MSVLLTSYTRKQTAQATKPKKTLEHQDVTKAPKGLSKNENCVKCLKSLCFNFEFLSQVKRDRAKESQQRS